ncbi:Hypothetical predicted protein, partial [Pelobates cultripes]
RLDAARSHLCVIKVQFTEQNIRTSKARAVMCSFKETLSYRHMRAILATWVNLVYSPIHTHE